MKNITDFIAANAGILCFGAAWIIATLMVAVTAYNRGWEHCCNAFASRTLDATRRQTYIRK